MTYYRLCEKIKGRSPLGYGTGPGRWNSRGTPLIYCCNTQSLNFLELLSIKGPIVSTASWQLVYISVSEEIPYLDVGELPKDWRNRPYPITTQYMGTMWATEKSSVCLQIPSCRIPLEAYPEEHNLLINPLHPDFFKTIQAIEIRDVSFEVNF